MARARAEGAHSAPVPPRTSSSRHTSNAPGSHRAPRADVGGATHTNVGKSAQNQDTWGACSGGSSKNFVGVFDGHGDMGHKISRTACDALQKNLFANSDLGKDPTAAFAKAYRDTQAQIINEHGEDANFSGTTAVAAYLNKDLLAVANVGDSRAVIGRCGTAASRASQASLCAIDLSSDHKPDRNDERRRIEQQGGKVGQSLFPVENMFGAVSFVRAGPARVMAPDGFSGLAMSRALGDAYLHPHVIAKPEIQERRLDSRDKLLILGSDGIWDMMGSQEAVNIARRHKDPNAAAREIADVSRKRWMKETNNTMTDDITAVVMRLDHKDKSSSGHRSERPVSAGKNSDRASGHRNPKSGLDHSGGSSTGQRSDHPASASKKTDRRGDSSTGQRSEHPSKTLTGHPSPSKHSDRTPGHNSTGSRVASVQSTGHRSHERVTGSSNHGHGQGLSQGYSQGHSRSGGQSHGHSRTRQDPPFAAAGARLYS